MSPEDVKGSPEQCTAWSLNLNLLCIVGACLGIAALFLTWISQSAAWAVDSLEPTILQMVVYQHGSLSLVSDELYYFAAVLFLVGSFAALATPVGGILQSISLVSFAWCVLDSGDETAWIYPQELRLGMYLGMASCCLVLMSLFIPLGTGSLRPGKSRNIRLTNRLLTIIPSIIEAKPKERISVRKSIEENGAASQDQGNSHEPSIALVWNVNLLCLIGAGAGVVAAFVAWVNIPWIYAGHWPLRMEPTLVFMVVDRWAYYAAAAAFIVGTIVALGSPLGGVLQSASLITFAKGIVDSGNDPWLHEIDPQQTLNIGMYLGIASCALVMTSLFKPLGTGSLRPRGSRKVRLMERLLTITPSIVEKRP